MAVFLDMQPPEASAGHLIPEVYWALCVVAKEGSWNLLLGSPVGCC